MKISCLPVSIFGDICNGKMDLTDWAREAKRIGYDGIDISILFLKNRTQTYIADLKKELAEIGLPIVVMTTYPDFTIPDEKQRTRELVYLKGDVCICSELGIRYLRILAGQAHPEPERQDCIRWVSDAFHEIDAFAKEYGVNLVFENHGKPGAWDCVDFTYVPKNFLDICEQIRDTDIRICYDTGNVTAYGADTVELVKKVTDLVEVVHVTDMKETGVFSPTVIGTGQTPNEEVFRVLKADGWDNWLCIEEASGNGLQGIEDAFHYVRRTWENA